MKCTHILHGPSMTQATTCTRATEGKYKSENPMCSLIRVFEETSSVKKLSTIKATTHPEPSDSAGDHFQNQGPGGSTCQTKFKF